MYINEVVYLQKKKKKREKKLLSVVLYIKSVYNQ